MLTLHAEVAGGLGVGHLVGVLPDVLRSGDGDDKTSDGALHLAHHVLVEVHGLAVLQPPALGVGVGDFTLQRRSLRLGHHDVLQRPRDGATWRQTRGHFGLNSGATKQLHINPNV